MIANLSIIVLGVRRLNALGDATRDWRALWLRTRLASNVRDGVPCIILRLQLSLN